VGHEGIPVSRRETSHLNRLLVQLLLEEDRQVGFGYLAQNDVIVHREFSYTLYADAPAMNGLLLEYRYRSDGGTGPAAYSQRQADKPKAPAADELVQID
jgi:hypothetical protein